MGLFASILLIFFGLICWGSVLFLLGLLAAAAWPRRARAAFPLEAQNLSVVVLIPAHNEEMVLAATLESLAAQKYPACLTEVVVVADNCTDETAQIAHAAGVTVMERRSGAERGKGYALQWALAKLLARPQPADAYVIADADTWLAPDFLEKITASLISHSDKRGFCALQGRYGVLNDSDGWRSALMSAAFDLFNHVKPLGRSRLGLSVGLKGNGMAFTRALLQSVPWRGDSITEDIDYALCLIREQNVRVCYAPEALVRAQMPVTATQAASQRSRWEGGRYLLLRDRALPILWEGVRKRNIALCDAACDLMLPPLAELAALDVLWAALVCLGAHFHCLRHPGMWLAAAFLPLPGLLLYILGGLRVSGSPRSAYLALLRAPGYAFWKFALYGAGLARRKTGAAEWVRTERSPISSLPSVHTYPAESDI